jgi:NAD(P)-dependent dehydrogenase (short-subunit alcohol dehydrogenase family)
MKVSELYDLKNNVAIVTGGTTGLGTQFAAALAECGVNLVIGSRRFERCKKTCEDFKTNYGVDALAVKLDVTQEEDVKSMVEKTVDYYGKINILVNNAGVLEIEDSVDINLSSWKRVIETNLSGVFLCCREVGKHMIRQNYGKIINIASGYGVRGRDWRNYVRPDLTNTTFSYSASKGGVAMLTKDLAVNWARYNITVNAISPGIFITEMTEEFCGKYTIEKLGLRVPMGRLGGDDDLKGALVFLSSNASKYVTGHNLVVDGGWTVWC